MNHTLYKRHVLSLCDYSESEIMTLLTRAQDLKQAKRAGSEQQELQGKTIALVFEKTSTRTRCAFEVAAYDQGAHVTYIDSQSSQMGHKESIADTARVLGRMFDAIVYRGFEQSVVETLARYAGVPVLNALTDAFHPTQMLADILTMQEHSKKALADVNYAYLGDGRNNVARSLLLVGSKLGMDVRIAAPKTLWADKAFVEECQHNATKTGARLLITEDSALAVQDVDFIYTDVWVSLGEPRAKWAERIDLLLPYQVNMQLIKQAQNAHVKFMHCLPALHNDKTNTGKEIAQQYPQLKEGVEVTEAVFESDYSIVFEQAENRLHTIKALLVSVLVEP